MRRTFSGVLVLAAMVAAGCDNDVENATPPTSPGPTVTETFTGNINVNGAATHTFPVAGAGTVVATLSQITPDNTTVTGFSLGTWNGSSCQAIIAKDDSVQGNTITGSVAGIGQLCARIYDVGKLTDTIGYTMTIVHP